MPSRRDVLVLATGLGTLLAVGAPALARGGSGHARSATAITRVFGDGIRLVAVAVEYDTPVESAGLSAASFRVQGRTVTGAYASTSADPADRAAAGRFVIVALSPEDENAALAEKLPGAGGGAGPGSAGSGAGGAGGAGGGPGGPGGGPGKAGDIPTYDTVYRTAQAEVVQAGTVRTEAGRSIAASGAALATTQVANLIVDDFRQLEFQDAKTGRALRYNLFVPKDYDARKSYPLVLFMHDAGATSDVTRTTLYQGLGAVVWASPENQARRPCFVLAPQYPEIIADDDSHTSNALDTTIDLIKALADEYSIDRTRLYTTGQSGGCMMSIAMDIKYPGFFAASFLVAGQWDPALVKPLASQKLWILVSQDDSKAFPGENAITAVLEKEGARISRATWDGTWDAAQFRAAFEKIDAEGSPINYVTFAKGTVIPRGDSSAGASGHRNTWRIAYTIEPIREWVFRQHG
ncbi:peptidase [Xanthomonas massiliensis]|uniref:carboxylesterase family protein n=1 Tax=Xanthomonas massiliensis TaxID=1720302 RepID=UPI000825387E|nr:peptidase [Xanthomonas massiliensis]